MSANPMPLRGAKHRRSACISWYPSLERRTPEAVVGMLATALGRFAQITQEASTVRGFRSEVCS